MTVTTWDSGNKATGITLSAGDLTATIASGAGGQEVVGTTTKTSGKWYFEFTNPGSLTNSGAQGICKDGYTAANSGAGAAQTNTASYVRFGQSQVNGGFQGDSGLGQYDGFVTACAVDMDNLKIWFRRGASGDWNGDATANPTTNTGGHGLGGGFSPTAIRIYAELANNPDAVTLNVGATSFTGTIPSGFSSWDAATPVANPQPVIIITQ